MKHSILILDDYIKSFSNVGVGLDSKYVFAYKDKQDVFKDSSVGDRIVGFLNAPTDQFVYIFEISNKISDKECELRKQIEVESGLDLTNCSKNLIQLVNANRATKLFFDISEKDYNLLLQRMVNAIEEKYSTVSDEDSRPLKFDAGFSSDKPRNRIVFGAPGTGKSRRLDNDVFKLVGTSIEQYERVTFHPEYTYGGFVGTYKPIESVDSNGNEIITYKYVPGPFMRMLVKALRSERSDNPQPFVLLVEEINRANVAAVFGDVFQLLDRKDNFSEYPIAPSEDIKRFIYDELGVECEELRLPDNFFIWATMNSADQGVFPMDTAFKRRWSFEYIGVDEGEKDSSGALNVPGSFIMNKGESNEVTIQWNALRKAINELLSCEDVKVPEDKLLGPFFVNSNNYMKDVVNDELADDFYKVIETKVLMYLFEDAAKTKRSSVFIGKANTNRFSVLCQTFEENPLGIFAKVGTKEFIDVYTSFVI